MKHRSWAPEARPPAVRAKLRRSDTPAGDVIEERDVAADEERWLRCASCGAAVTKDASRIAMNGAHEHEFMNPAAVRFTVHCFAEAPGSAPAGEPSTVWTWFPGFAWRIALCRACGAHLGWSFHGSRTFYGLVKDMLVSSATR